MSYAIGQIRALLLLSVASCALAQDVDQTASLSPRRTLGATDVGGIVTGQTITLAGRTFYDSFAATWRDQDEDGRFVVDISERPSARWGSQVFVDYGHRRLFQAFLPPNLSRIAPIGASAAARVYQAILEDQLAQVFADPDLARNEF